MAEHIQHDKDKTQRRAALMAGIGLLMMVPLAVFAFFIVIESLVVPGDAATTASNMRVADTLFRLGIMAFVIIAILDILVAWALYVVFQPVQKNIALLAGWFRLAYAAVFLVAFAPLLQAIEWLSTADYLTAFTEEQLAAQVMLEMHRFQNTWDLGLGIFGLHLLVLGCLVYRASFIPRWVGVLVVVAGAAYTVDSIGGILVANYALDLASYAFVGEVLLIGWLMWLGFRRAD